MECETSQELIQCQHLDNVKLRIEYEMKMFEKSMFYKWNMSKLIVDVYLYM